MMGLVLFLAALSPGQPYRLEYPPQHSGDVEARLEIVVPEEGAGPWRSRLLVTLSFTGPPGLEVQGPRLEDALAAWRVVRRWSSWGQEGQQVHWSLTLQLEQIKPGQVAPPGLVAEVRTGPEEPWREVSWLELLSEPRDVAPPDFTSPLPVSAWPDRLRWVSVGLACGLLVLLLVRAVRRRLLARQVQPPDIRALARLEVGALPPADRPAERFAHAEAVVRDYLDEQHGLKTRQQTTREIVARLDELPPEARDAFRELLDRGELVKFAAQAPTAEECDRAVELARLVIRACATATWPASEGGMAGEPGKTVPAG
jgi:hypothetical protein